MSRSGRAGSSEGICIIGSTASESAIATENSSKSAIKTDFRLLNWFEQRGPLGPGVGLFLLLSIKRRRGFRAGIHQSFQFGHESRNVFEFKVNGCEPHVSDLIEVLQTPHDHLSDLVRVQFAIEGILDLLFHLIDYVFEL